MRTSRTDLSGGKIVPRKKKQRGQLDQSSRAILLFAALSVKQANFDFQEHCSSIESPFRHPRSGSSSSFRPRARVTFFLGC